MGDENAVSPIFTGNSGNYAYASIRNCELDTGGTKTGEFRRDLYTRIRGKCAERRLGVPDAGSGRTERGLRCTPTS